MTDADFTSLDIGDIVRHCNGAHALIVMATQPLTFARLVFPLNPMEWDIVSKARHENDGKHPVKIWEPRKPY